MRTLVAAIGLVALAALCLARPQVARAECPYFVIPPATEAVRSAREVIVGTVVENVDGQLDDFRLRIDHVFRGQAQVGEVRRFSFLYPGWPPDRTDKGPVLTDQGEPFMPCEPIPGWKGNVIALALDALAPDGSTRYNAASWISGDLPVNWDLPRTTLAEVKRLAAMPATDTVAEPDPVSAVPADSRFGSLLLASGLGIGAMLAWRRTRAAQSLSGSRAR